MARDRKLPPVCSLSRRDLLKAAGVGVGLTLLPGLRGVAGADTPLRANAPAKRVLILNMYGAPRLSAVAPASTQMEYNPYGQLATTSTKIPYGGLLDDAMPDSSYLLGPEWGGAKVPRFSELAKEWSGVGTWDESRGDHIGSRINEPSGSYAGDLAAVPTRIAAALTGAIGGANDQFAFQVPPLASFGRAGSLARFVPITLAGPEALPIPDAASTYAPLVGRDFAGDDAMRYRLSQELVDRRSGYSKNLAGVLHTHLRAAKTLGATLAEPWVNVGDASAAYRNASKGTVRTPNGMPALTNAMLYGLFLRALEMNGYSSGSPDQHLAYTNVVNTALAVRLLQFGASCVVCEWQNFDSHADEPGSFRPLYPAFARTWATLRWLLSNMPDPAAPGKSYLDTTLVYMMGDFSRDRGSTTSGFNGGTGTDHGNDTCCYYMLQLVMGAGIQRDKWYGEVPSTGATAYDARKTQIIRETELHATALWALGLDPRNEAWGFPDVAPANGDPPIKLWG